MCFTSFNRCQLPTMYFHSYCCSLRTCIKCHSWNEATIPKSINSFLSIPDAQGSKGADYIPLTPVKSSSSNRDHHSSRSEQKRPHARRQHRDVDKHGNADSASRFIKPLPEKPLESGDKDSTSKSASARKTDNRGVRVDSSMLAAGQYVEYDPVDTSIWPTSPCHLPSLPPCQMTTGTLCRWLCTQNELTRWVNVSQNELLVLPMTLLRCSG